MGLLDKVIDAAGALRGKGNEAGAEFRARTLRVIEEYGAEATIDIAPRKCFRCFAAIQIGCRPALTEGLLQPQVDPGRVLRERVAGAPIEIHGVAVKIPVEAPLPLGQDARAEQAGAAFIAKPVKVQERREILRTFEQQLSPGRGGLKALIGILLAGKPIVDIIRAGLMDDGQASR